MAEIKAHFMIIARV